jgi:protocatechuate 3,4-dioxygenase beta subunit
MNILIPSTRRGFFRGLTLAAASFAVPGVLAEQLTLTPKMTEGPFYPDKLPLDTDNDLLIVNTGITPAIGEITHLTGRVLTASGAPLRNAVVEIWQCDQNGAYIHSRSGNAARRDGNFQGFGRFLTNAKGEYYFRTIKPVPYPGRTPHIHFAINRGGKRILTTQMLVKGHPQNERDGVFRSVRDERQRAAVMAEFKPLTGSKIGELAASFDLVLGVSPEA